MSLSQRFMALFAGLDRAHGVYIPRGPSSSGKIAGSARTEHNTVTEELWDMHLSGEQGLGIVPITDDNSCKWGALDIDKYDLDLPALVKLVAKHELPLVTVRSKSGGAHLYLFLEESLPAVTIRIALISWAVILGHGGVEVFPKQENLASRNDVGNWLNMPYFNEASTVQYGLDGKGQALGAQQFLDIAQRKLTPVDLVVPKELEAGQILVDGPPCLQILMQQGIGEGGRNTIIFNYAVYVRKRFGDDAAIVEEKVDEFNRNHVKPSLGSREVQDIVKHAMKKSYAYTCKQSPLADVCQLNICRSRRFGVGFGDSGPPLAFGELVKITTEPPFYVLEIEGRRMELSVEELYSQDRFRRACMERIDVIPFRIKGPRWDAMLADLMKQVVIQEAPPDASPDGQIQGLLEEWVSTAGATDIKVEMLLGKPYIEGDTLYFRSTHFLKFVRANGFVGLKENQLWKYLRRLGADHQQWHIENRSIRCWSLEWLPLETVELPVPKVNKDSGNF